MSTTEEEQRISALRRYNILDTAPETEFENTIGLVQSTFNVPMAAISFIDTDRQWFKASRGLEVTQTPRDIAFCDYTIRNDEPFVVSDAKSDERFEKNPFVTGEAGVQCYLGVPLKTPAGQNIGTLCVIGTEPREFSPEEAAALTGFGKLVVSQLELCQAANLDNLTHTMSRGAFLDQLDIAIKSFRQKGIGSTLAILDIDKFKELNDTYGHPVGDKVLQEFVSAILSTLRGDDLLGRLGGDEFGILLRGVTPATASVVLARVHDQVMAINLAKYPDIKVGMSLGYVAISDDVMSKEAWIQLADDALYQAKNNGRNQICNARSA